MRSKREDNNKGGERKRTPYLVFNLLATTVMEEIGAVEPPWTDAQGLVDEEVDERGRGEIAGNRNQIPDGDPDDEEDVCRICRTPGEADSSLYHPCACSGSIKYVHQECLLQWLNHSNARQCEVC